jgi:hypothetical protein
MKEQILNPVAVARAANPKNYKPNYGKDKPSELEEETDEQHSDSPMESEEEEVLAFIKHEKHKLRSAKAKQDFFSGIRLQLRVDSVEMHLHIENRPILRFSELHPNWHLKISNICTKIGFVEKDLALQVTLREIAITDYFSQAYASKIACIYALDALKRAPNTLDINGPDMRSSVASICENNLFAFGTSQNDGRNSSASRDVDYFGSAAKGRSSRSGS